MNEQPVSTMSEITLEKLREMLNGSTVAGQPIVTADGTTVIPVSKVSVGFTTGGSQFNGKTPEKGMPYAAGGGAGMTMTPMAFVISANGETKVVGIGGEPAPSDVAAAVEKLPTAVEKIYEFFASKKKKAEEEAAAE
ncbi:MAG: sporulation protein YtfJ [Clostridia bacterium]|nr:sporulation protein YtfJ [Clostridia bacterium]